MVNIPVSNASQIILMLGLSYQYPKLVHKTVAPSSLKPSSQILPHCPRKCVTYVPCVLLDPTNADVELTGRKKCIHSNV
jgi:hypothetical protein